MNERNVHRNGNLAVAAAVAAAVAFLSWLFRFPVLSPHVWDDVAAGALLRPPAGVIGGFVRGLHQLVFALFSDPESALFAITASGWLSAAVIAFLAYQVLWNLAQPYAEQLSEWPAGRLLTRGCLSVATVLFVCNDAVWTATQALSATGLQLAMILAALWMTLKFLWEKRRRYAFAAMLLYGLLVGETPVGYAGAVLIVVIAMRTERVEEESALTNPLARMFFRRMLTLEFFAAVTAALAAEIWIFTVQGGVHTGESALVDFVASYGGGLWNVVRTAASWRQWVLSVVVVLAPAYLALHNFRRQLEGDDFLPTYQIVVNFLLGILAWTQACGITRLSFRFWFADRTELSPLLVALFALVSCATLVWLALILGARLYYGAAREWAGFHYDDACETNDGRRTIRVMTRLERWSKPAFVVFVVATLVTAVAMRYEATPRRMMALVGEYLDETVRECAGLERLVTDGALDAGVELVSLRSGGSLLAVSMTAGNGPRDVKIRQRGITATDDLESLQSGFPNTLRSWIDFKPEVLKSVGVQLALDQWRKESPENRPTAYGVVARIGGKDADEFERTKAWAMDFAGRILELYADSVPDGIIDRRLHELFLFVQFRVARFCQWRAEAAGTAEWGDVSRAEQDLADRLDAKNVSYQEAKRITALATGVRNLALTPRESLKMCLQNADFNAAIPFAERVYAADPDDPQANFAFGMHYLLAKNYSRAEPYLVRCLAKRPQDPAVLNNLAIAERELGRYEIAEKHAREALVLFPDSPHLHRTLDSILKAKDAK